jgi:hypothetical protein
LVELYAKGLIQDDVKSDDCGKEPLPVSGLWRTVANKFIEFVTVDNVTRLRWANRTSGLSRLEWGVKTFELNPCIFSGKSPIYRSQLRISALFPS